MTPYSYEQLEQYLDNELSAAERTAIDADASNNAELKHELTALIASAEAVRYYGITQQVAAIQQEYLATKKPAAVRHILRPAMRVAASIIIIVALFGAYKYSTVNARNVTADYYVPYELNIVRGDDDITALEKAYNNKNWNAVISLVNPAHANNEELFLAGAAYFELNQPAKAADMFNQLLEQNQSTDFRDEAEYYLALSYISNNDAAKAIPILKRIRADKGHLYHDKAEKMSMLDLRILSWKK